MRKFLSVILFATIVSGILGASFFNSTNNASAASSITLNVSPTITLDVTPSNAGSTSATDTTNIAIKTDNATGYTLSIAAGTNAISNGNNTVPNANNTNVSLINTDPNCTTTAICTIASIATNTTYTNVSSFSTNTWGYMLSKYNTSTTNWDNLYNYYQAAPTTTASDIDTTSAPNASTFNNYNLSIATKVDDAMTPGTYENTFIIAAITNPLVYNVTYTNASGISASNMPTNISGGMTAAGEGSFIIPSTTPTRTGYTFNKWCTVTPTTTNGVDACTGGDEYASSATYNLTGTTSPQSVTLYAMWTANTYSLTVNFAGSGVSSVQVRTASGTGGTLTGTVSSSGGSVSLKYGNTYYIYPVYTSGYEYDSIAKASGTGTLGTGSNPTWLVGLGAGTVTVTGKASCVAFPTNTNMQSFDGTINYCSPGTLKDSRDNQTYKVAKLADGKWWMLDNLALDIVANKSSITSSNTHASDASLSKLKNGGGTTSDKYATAAIANWTSSYSYSAPLQNTASKNTVPSNPPSNGQGSNKVGVYYNYCAASAGSYCYGSGTSAGTSTGNATEDICPKGWRLPTGASLGEFQALYNNSNYNTLDKYRTALSLPFSGDFNNGSPDDQGYYGFWWSSTRYSNPYMYDLGVAKSYIDPAYDNYRYYGYSIRCIMGS